MGMSGKKRWLLWGLGGVVALLLLPALLLALILEGEPLVGQGKLAAAADAARTRQLAERSHQALQDPGGTFHLSFSEDEVNSLMAFISRGLHGSAGRAEVTADGIATSLTLQIRDNPLGRYVNLAIVIRPSTSGLNIGTIRLGHLRIPGLLVTTLAPPLLDIFPGQGVGHLAFSSISTVIINGKDVSITGQSTGDLKERLSRVKRRLQGVRDQVAYLGDPLLVRIYYQQLMDTDRSLPQGASVSLARYIGPLFALAQQRGGAATTENQAAILALAIFLCDQHIGEVAGPVRIEELVGPVRTANMEEYQPRRGQVTLDGQVDKCLHFLLSAALRIISERGMAIALGEFKELVDAGRTGGSGFSFADLTADRAGVRFAELAIRDNSQAALYQKRLGSGEEAVFFPGLAEVPEGITRQEFESYYHDVESPPYLAMVAAIDRCLDRLPLYREAQQPVASGGVGVTTCQIAEVVPLGLRRQSGPAAMAATKKVTSRPVGTGRPLGSEPPIVRQSAAGSAASGVQPGAGVSSPPDAKAAPATDVPGPRPDSPGAAPGREEHRESLPPAKTEPKSQEERQIEQKIENLQEKLTLLRKRYTEKHPDVRAVRRELEALQNRP